MARARRRLALRHMAHAPLAAGATAMQPHHLGVGRGLINERQETITFVAALRWHGMRASQTIDGSMTFANCEVFGFSAIRSLGNNATAVRSDRPGPAF